MIAYELALQTGWTLDAIRAMNADDYLQLAGYITGKKDAQAELVADA